MNLRLLAWLVLPVAGVIVAGWIVFKLLSMLLGAIVWLAWVALIVGGIVFIGYKAKEKLGGGSEKKRLHYK